MPLYILKETGVSSYDVSSQMFGGNILGGVNESTGTPNIHFQEAMAELGTTRLRYPGGKAEAENITELDHSKSGPEKLRIDLREYLDWIRETGTETTLVLPAHESRASDADLQEWSNIVLSYMGDDASLIVAYEIGNEYWGNVSEVEYGNVARDIISSLTQSFDADGEIYTPKIWIQTANPVGGFSSYKGDKSGSISDSDAILALGNWNVSSRPSDWKIGQSAVDYYRSLNSFEKTIIKANLELLEQLDRDFDITNGFQSDVENFSLDGITAHYYYKRTQDELGGVDDAWQSNYLNHRFSVWEAMLPHDVEIQITEWNVRASNYQEIGLKAAGVLQEQFQSMLELGVVGADFWALQHNTKTSVAGDHKGESPVSLSPSGLMYKYMSESLIGIGNYAMSSFDLSGYDNENMEINAYKSNYRTVLYITSRSTEFGQEISFNVDGITSGTWNWNGRLVGIDPTSSNGLSEHWSYDEDGQEILHTRVAKREVTPAEFDELQDLLGDNLADQYVKRSNDGKLMTYLPSVEGIIPRVLQPQTLDDFYFATESDVLGKETLLSKSDLGSSSNNLSVELDPFEFVEITIDTIWKIEGTNGEDALTGAWGRDEIYGRDGNDKLYGDNGEDLIYGGGGDDHIYGGLHYDTLYGGDGNDQIWGGWGQDKVYLGNGDDVFHDHAQNDEHGADMVRGGNG
ncbi:MAG: calcium-binding protein, partial [Sedimentitalea sp.]|uniref:calcium-binding protein n=1 Tax=Sedimentitalea sp. TaxID=2048915 RepID=UPI0032976F0B